MYAPDRTNPDARPVRPDPLLDDEPPRTVSPSVVAAAASLVAMWPYTSVIEPGGWSSAVVAVIIMVALSGMASRTLLRRRRPWARDLITLTVQTLVAIGTVTQLTAGDAAVLGVIPTEGSTLVFQTLLASSWEQIVYGVAPLNATVGLAAVMASGFAMVAILLDQLVANRAAIVACLLTAAVGAVPMIVALGGADLVWFVMLSVIVLVLLRHAAARQQGVPRPPAPVAATVIGAAAIAGALVITPMLPVAMTLAGTGAGVTVDASLRLGDDLRQPDPVEVLTLATDADTAPYLRLTTLSDFDGEVWEPDHGELQSQREGFGPDEWGEEISTTSQSTSIRVVRMSSEWLPAPYAATDVRGVPVEWRLNPQNRTITTRAADAAGEDYTVVSTTVTPTLEQIRATPAADREIDEDAEPLDLPPIIADTAAEVTDGATNDYDRLIALQSWFRSDFAYSLETPVDEGFDGTGADAVAAFLEARSGYCIHFAGAFALMADSLDMEVRIVVGYLPGVRTSADRAEEAVYSVSSQQLHSWPEVLFPGIGWVPFEPTASLGVPTDFRAASTGQGDAGNTSSPAPTRAPVEQETTAPETARPDAGDNAGTTGQLRRVDTAPIAVISVGVLLVLLLPALIRTIGRAGRRGLARRGDAGAAWTELRSTLIDLGIPVSDAESPRVRAAGLITDAGADAESMRTLAAAIERASYAPSPAMSTTDLDRALGQVLRGVRRSVDRRARVQAFLLPRSLWAARQEDAASMV